MSAKLLSKATDDFVKLRQEHRQLLKEHEELKREYARVADFHVLLIEEVKTLKMMLEIRSDSPTGHDSRRFN